MVCSKESVPRAQAGPRFSFLVRLKHPGCIGLTKNKKGAEACEQTRSEGEEWEVHEEQASKTAFLSWAKALVSS